MRRPLIAANWKMHKTLSEAVSFMEALQEEIGPCNDRDVVIAPSFTAIASVAAALRLEGFKLSAQNCHYEEKGAYTGEVSALMLKDVDCTYVILGHSERRHIFGETDEFIQKKVVSAFKHGIVPILCVGEVLDEREAGKTMEVVEKQIGKALQEMSGQQASELVIAYEPVWAIGTGKTATPEQAQEVHRFLRERVAALFDKTIAKGLRIVYGGSVKPDNVDSLMAMPDIDGFLVGGASLEVSSFKRIVQCKIS